MVNKKIIAISEHCGIYIIRNDINHKCYVGSSIHIWERIRGHYSLLRQNKHWNVKLQKAWNKYEERNFTVIPIFFCEEGLELKYEEDFIRIYNSYKNGYNNIDIPGSKFNKGKKFTEEHKEKIRIAAKNRYSRIEERQKTSDSIKARYSDPETLKRLRERQRDPDLREKRRKISIESWKNPVIRERRSKAISNSFTEKVRQKISESNKGKKKSEQGRENIRKGCIEKYKNPENRLKTKEALNTPEVKKKLSDAMKRLLKDPEYLEKMSEAHKRGAKTRKENNIKRKNRDEDGD